MPKQLYASLALLLATSSMVAGPVSKEQAQQKAAAFALKDGRTLSLVKNSVHKAPQATGQSSPYYVFDMADNAGFVIISGDDRTRAVIGYTESGSFDADNIPENMRSWLQMVSDRITTLPDESTTPTVSLAQPQATESGVPMANVIIGPLMKSTWNQGTPYWDHCPYRNGKRCYTGCTATAFSQVMYYWKWPQSATTSIPGYEDDGLSYGTLGSTTFDWNNMKDSYSDSDSGTASGNAVANLLHYVGKGALMHYTEGGSGAAFVHAINALKNYFGYPSDIYEIYKDNYSSGDWMNAVYSELYYGRPVLIEGYSDSSWGGGHAFVCDGYRDDGCFHINWGWGGWCDGYFSLDVLNPDDHSGMGAAQGGNGYYWHEGAVMNVRRSDGGSGGGSTSLETTDRGVATFYQDASYGGYGYSLPEGSFTLSQMKAYGIQNDDISSLKVLPGYKVTLYADDNFSGATATFTGDASYVGSDWNDQASSIKIEPNGATGLSGNYKLQNRNSGKYMDLDGNRTDDNTAIVQWEDEGSELYQQWRLNEVESGVYTIQAMATDNRGLDVAYASVENSAQVLLYTYNGGHHQQFILVDKGDSYYQLVARHCGKPVEMPGSSTTSGEWTKIWENNGSNCQQWKLIPGSYGIEAAPTPDKASENVISVYSNAYNTQTPNLADGQWGQQTQTQGVELDGNNAFLWKNFNYMGLEYNTDLNVSNMEYLHVDIYPTSSFTIKLSPVSSGPNETLISRDLTANQWNSIDIALSEFTSVNKSQNFQLKFDGGSGQTLYVDNIYYWKNPTIDTGETGSYSVATFYQDIYYGGYAVSLPEGTYTQAQLEAHGIKNNDITSFKVMPGFKVTIYDGSNFNDESRTWTEDCNWMGSDWNDRASSIKIETNGATGLSGIHKLQNKNSGKYMDLDGNRTDNSTAIVQWDDEGTELYQQWRFNEIETGIYTIQAAATDNRGLDVANIGTENGTQVLLYDYWNGAHQQWIAVDKGNGYYQFVARNCGRVVEMPNASTTSGERIQIWDNNNQDCSWWKLADVVEYYNVDLTDNGGTYSVSHTSVNAQEAPSMLFDNNAQTKYCAFINAGDVVTLQYNSTQSARLTSYTLTSANDFDGRDPKSWQLQGSNDGSNWETIDQRSDEYFSERYQQKSYDVATSKEYTSYRLVVTELRDASITVFQVAEWQLFGMVAKGTYDHAVTGIDQTPAEEAKAADTPFNVYTINGQLVKRGARSTEGLPTGIYIINRKKVVVK